MKSFIQRHTIHRRIAYILMLILILTSDLSNRKSNLSLTIVICAILCTIFILDEMVYFFELYNTPNLYPRYCYVKVFIFTMFEAKLTARPFMFSVFLILTFMAGFEYLLHNSSYDKNSYQLKKLFMVIPILISSYQCFVSESSDTKLLSFLALQIVVFGLISYVADIVIDKDELHAHEMNSVRLEKSKLEQEKEKLIEYRDKVKMVNEQINFQRIDLARSNKDLEQAYNEIESQTEVMKYMASTFNAFKCMNAIVDSIMEIKKPKICAMYVRDDVFMNKYPSCIIKTNYTSLETRLNKDIAKIYAEFNEKKLPVQIFKNEEIRQFRFIGTANINSMAILPIINGYTIYGIMIVASDDVNFFEKGLTYYETSIVEFNISVNSIQLYLQMQDMARKDGLTGIYNRVYFGELFSEVAEEARQKKTDLSVALYDIDKFKRVNDTYGHLAGDEVIKMVASMGQKYAERYNGFTCRFGGEEFLLVLPGKNDREALAILEEMHEEIKNTTVKYSDMNINVNVCIGLSSYPSLCSNTDLLVNRADKAMYYGKKNGRGRLIVDNPEIE